MGKVIVTDTHLTNIANAIRAKAGTSNTYTPAQMATAINNIPTGGGATNFVTGTFTPSGSGAAATLTLSYSGSGYPIFCAIVPEDGGYNPDADIYTLLQRYVITEWYMVKSVASSTPSYGTSGTNNQGMTEWVYKSSATTATSYSRSGAQTTNTYSSSNATAAGATAVRFKSKTSISYFVAGTSYGLASGIKYRYYVIYSQ